MYGCTCGVCRDARDHDDWLDRMISEVECVALRDFLSALTGVGADCLTVGCSTVRDNPEDVLGPIHSD